MSIQAAYVVPHPPLIIPSVGRGEERGIQKTLSMHTEQLQSGLLEYALK